MGYEEAISFAELHKAVGQCANGVRWKESVQQWLRQTLKRTYLLRQDLLNGKYKISKYTRFTITEPKRREILSTKFRDRVFQRSMCNNGIYADLTRSFISDNCACQIGRGVDYAIRRMRCHLERSHRKNGVESWVLKLDVRKFFQSIPHEVAKRTVAKRITDENILKHVCDVIDSFGECGLALGSQISQLIALAVLDDFDHIIKERFRIRFYVRYMDDMIFIHENEEVLRGVWDYTKQYLAGLGLTLNPKSCLFPLKQGLVFLKYRFFFTASGKLISKVCHKSVSRERRKLRALKKLWRSKVLTTQDIRDHFTSWCAHVKRANSRGLIESIRQYGHQIFTT